MLFDRHGNRIWASAQTLLDSEHARRAVGEVSVPFGICREPSNVAAAGQACPVRDRPAVRGGPHLPLSAPRPARASPRLRSPATRRARRRARSHPGLTPGRPAGRRERSARLATRVRQLEQRLSQALGEQAWRESGFVQPGDTAQLEQQITQLAEHNQQLQADLAERDQVLAAARNANRELMARLNTRS